MYSSDSSGNAKDLFALGESVFVTVPATDQRVSFYVVAEQSTWNEGDSLTDVSFDGVETVTLDSGMGTQTIFVEIWPASLMIGEYDIVLDLDRDGVFDVELDLVDDIDVIGFFVVPEVPLGTIMGLVSMFIVLIGYIAVKRYRQNLRQV